ncbi:TlpA family protein disulfide reductase [Formosa sp. 4Alg 33]|uniref:TlpA family protein disulfide reductase n=1 Tax=Formosa sp. 4Alg 33 TaxID=3382189 RepID=UPI003D9C130C
MKTNIRLLILAFCLTPLFYGCVDKKSKTESETKITENLNINDSIPVYDFEALEPLLYTNSDKIHIVNFWAMWCAPCVKELPIIKKYAASHPDVEVTLVSLDFPRGIETKLKPFLKDNAIDLKVVLLDDPDSNTWIDKINSNWSGSIPFTIIFNNEKRSYHERDFESIEDLETEIQNTFNN